MYNQKPWLGMELNRKHRLAKGLIDCHVFNEHTGKIVFDLSDNGNHGTINGADWCADGLDFIAANQDYIDCGNISSYFSTEGTLMMHLKLNANVPSNLWHTGLCQFGINEASSHYPYTDSIIYLDTFRDDRITLGNIGIDKSNWHTITITSKPGANNWKVYQNKNEIFSTTGKNIVYIPTSFTVGKDVHKDTNYYLDGIVSYYYVYNRGLSPLEIAEINADPYQMFKQPIRPELMDYTASGAGWTGKVCGVTNPGEINGVAVANIAKVMGI